MAAAGKSWSGTNRALEELAHWFSLHHEGDLDRFYELRQYYADQLIRVITTLIVKFEGPQLCSKDASDEEKGCCHGVSRRSLVQLAYHVAKKTVKNILGKEFSAFEYLLFVGRLGYLKKQAERGIRRGEFQKNSFYRKIVEMMNSSGVVN
eukprot:g5015.t1